MLDRLERFAADINIKGPLPEATADTARLQLILNTIFGIMGSVAVLIIVIAGFRYVNSRGDPGATAKAKDTILYTFIGLIIMITAYAIIAFALGAF